MCVCVCVCASVCAFAPEFRVVCVAFFLENHIDFFFQRALKKIALLEKIYIWVRMHFSCPFMLY